MNKKNRLERGCFGRNQFSVILIVSLLLILTAIIKPGYTGYIIKETEFEFNNSSKYDLNETNILSLKLTGIQKGDGEVKVYLGEYGVLKSEIIKNASKDLLEENSSRSSYLFENLGIENISNFNSTLIVVLNNVSLILTKIDYEINLFENKTEEGIILEQSYAEIGKLVNWKKIIKSDNLTELVVSVPKDAVVISVKDKWGNNLELHDRKGFGAKDISEKGFIVKSDYAEIEYQTEAPWFKEEFIDGKKRVSIYFEYEYVNITTYANLTDVAKDITKQLINDSYREQIRTKDSIIEKDGVTKEYIASEKKLKITELGNTILEAKLLTPYNVQVPKGDDVKIAEFLLIGYDKDLERFDFIDTYDIKNNYTESYKNMIYKYLSDKKETCVNQTEIDEYGKETKIKVCYNKTIWTEFNGFNELPKGDIIIGLFTNTEYGEHIEWVPAIKGFELLEWGSWETRESGYAYCWGYNSQGQLGIGNTSDKWSPMQVLYGLNLTSIDSGGSSSTCGLVLNGSAYCWGGNSQGQLGIGNTSGKHQPISVLGSLNFTNISTGDNFACGTTLNDTIYCWGGNSQGQLGIGNTSGKYQPIAMLSTDLNFTRLVAGYRSTCGIVLNGSAYCWGYNGDGQLGIGNTSAKWTPIAVSGSLNFTQISGAGYHTCGIVLNGSAYCWGDNSQGQLGIGNTSDKYQPTGNVTNNFNFTFIVASGNAGDHSCGIVLNGSTYCWGSGDYGELGIGYGTDNIKQPVLVLNNILFSSIEIGNVHTYGTALNGSAYSWGRNIYGQLGIGNTSDKHQPIAALDSLNFTYVSSGMDYGCGYLNNYIVTPEIDFVEPTLSEGFVTTNTSIIINITSSNVEDLDEFNFNWNGTNYTMYNNSLVLMFNFDNISSLGENMSLVVDASSYGNNGAINGSSWTESGKYNFGMSFDGVNDSVSVSDSTSLNITGSISLEAWIKANEVQWNGDKQNIISKWGYANTAEFQTTNSWDVYNASNEDGANGARGYMGGVFDGKYVYFAPLYSSSAYHGNVLRYDTANNFSDTNSWDVYNASNEDGANGARGYQGGVFDGKYVYFAPLYSSAYHGNVLRYDTTNNFSDTNSWDVYNASNEDGANGARGYQGGVFDGKYVYFAPYLSNVYHSNVLRYDTANNFSDTNSWDVYNASNEDGANSAKGYRGVVFDGKYVYFAPYYNGIAYHGNVLRYDTTNNFSDTNSWDVYNASNEDGANGARGYQGGVFDGKYVYFAPYLSNVYHSNVLRYDTTNNFSDTNSWDVYNASNEDGANGARAYYGGVFDGKYVYFAPYYNGIAYHGNVLRYDTTNNFSDTNSWDVYNASNENGANGARGYQGGVFDGKYVYFAPLKNGVYHGDVLRYDATNNFSDTNSWDVYNASNENGANGSRGYAGGVFDGKYVYFAPLYNGIAYHSDVLRYDTANNKSSYSLDYSSSANLYGDTPKSPVFRINTGSGIRSVSYVGRNSNLSENWTYFVGTYNGSVISLYIDGVLQNTINYTTSAGIQSSITDLVIGSDYGGRPYFNGTIDEVRIWNVSLGADEITQHYYSNLKKNSADTWFLYVNQSNLTNGTFTYYGAVIDDSSNEAKTGIRSFVIANKAGPDTEIVNQTYNGTTDVNENIGVPYEYNLSLVVNVTSDANVSKVWMDIWDGLAGVSNLLYRFFFDLISGNYLNGLWQVMFPINSTFNLGLYNYTINANDTFGFVMNNTTGNFSIDYPPVLDYLKLYPSITYANYSLTCNNGSTQELDNQNITFIYTWFKNGAQLAIDKSSNILYLSGNATLYDNITCVITPFDGIQNGTSFNSTKQYIVDDYQSEFDNGVYESCSFSNGSIYLKPELEVITGTVGLWHLNEEYFDYSTNRNNFSASNIVNTTGRLNKGYNFTGENSSLYLLENAYELQISNNLTLEAWVKLDNYFNNGSKEDLPIIDKGDYKLYFDHYTGKLVFELNNDSTNKSLFYDPGASYNYVYSVGRAWNRLYLGTGNDDGESDLFECNGTVCAKWYDFGADINSVLALKEYNGKLYVGTGGADGEGELFECNETKDCALIFDTGVLSKGVDSFEIYNDRLYAGMGGDAGESRLIECNSTRECAKFYDPGVGINYVDSLKAWNGNLYAGLGTDDGDAKLLECNSTTRICATFKDTGGAYNRISTIETFRDKLYYGTGSDNGEGDLFECNKTKDCAKWYDGNTSINIISSLEEFNNKLYAGLGTDDGDAFVYRCNRTTCEGWYEFSSGYNNVYALEEYNGKLYAGLGIDNGEGDLWSFGQNIVLNSSINNITTQWHFLTAKYDTKNISLYLDGVLDKSEIVGNIRIDKNDTDLYVGYDDENSWFNGTIDEIRILNKSLDSDVIYKDYNRGANDNLTGTYTSDIFDGGRYANWSNLSFFGVFGTEYSNTSNTVALWHFANNLYDSVSINNGTGNNLEYTLFGRVPLSGGAYIFNEENSSIKINETESLQLKKNMTLEGWIKLKNNFNSNAQKDLPVIDKGDYRVYLSHYTGELIFELNNDSTNKTFVNDTGTDVNLIKDVEIYKDKLVFGTGLDNGEGDIYECNRTEDTCAKLKDPGAGVNYVYVLKEYNNNLFFGIGGGSDEAELHEYNESTGTSAKFFDPGVGRDYVASIEPYNNNLFFGTSGIDGNGDLYECNDTTNTCALFYNFDNYNEVASLKVWMNKLYVGLGYDEGEGDLYECNGTTDTCAMLYNLENDTISSLEVYDGKLYLGTGNDNGDGGIFECNQTRECARFFNFGNSVNSTTALEVYNGKLYAGTGLDGGEGDIFECNATTRGCAKKFDLGVGVNAVNSLKVYNGKLYAGLGIDNGEGDLWSFGQNIVLNSSVNDFNSDWHFFAATFNSSNMNLYLDGNIDRKLDVGVLRPDKNNSYFYIGNDHSDDWFNGTIDEIGILNEYLNDSDILEDYINTYKTVKLQIRTSKDNSSWSDWIGPSNLTSEYFTGDSILEIANSSNRYIQYKALIEVNSSLYSVSLNKVIILNSLFYPEISNSNLSITNVWHTPNLWLQYPWLEPSQIDNVTIYINVSDYDEDQTIICNISGNITETSISGSVSRNNITLSKDLGKLDLGRYDYNISCYDDFGYVIYDLNNNFTVTNVTLNVSIMSLSPNPVNKSEPLTISGKLNLSDGRNVSDNLIYIWLNGKKILEEGIQHSPEIEIWTNLTVTDIDNCVINSTYPHINCIVNTSCTASYQNYTFDSLTVNSGVTITAGSGTCGYAGGRGGRGFFSGFGCIGGLGGEGGAGGSCLTVYSKRINVQGTITSNGATGSNGADSSSAAGGGGGGGSGGNIRIYSDEINITGTLQANGQNGGTGGYSEIIGGGGGGGGGGGSIILFGDELFLTGTIQTSKGSGGSGSYKWGSNGNSGNGAGSIGGTGGDGGDTGTGSVGGGGGGGGGSGGTGGGYASGVCGGSGGSGGSADTTRQVMVSSMFFGTSTISADTSGLIGSYAIQDYKRTLLSGTYTSYKYLWGIELLGYDYSPKSGVNIVIYNETNGVFLDTVNTDSYGWYTNSSHYLNGSYYKIGLNRTDSLVRFTSYGLNESTVTSILLNKTISNHTLEIGKLGIKVYNSGGGYAAFRNYNITLFGETVCSARTNETGYTYCWLPIKSMNNKTGNTSTGLNLFGYDLDTGTLNLSNVTIPNNITIYEGNNISIELDSIIRTDSNGFYNFTFLSPETGSYLVEVNSTYQSLDNMSNKKYKDLVAYTSNTLVVNNKLPNLTSIWQLPSHPAQIDNITVYVNVSDGDPGQTMTCNVSGRNITLSTGTNTTNSDIITIGVFIGNLTGDTHYYNVSCTDGFNVNNSNLNYNLTVIELGLNISEGYVSKVSVVGSGNTTTINGTIMLSNGTVVNNTPLVIDINAVTYNGLTNQTGMYNNSIVAPTPGVSTNYSIKINATYLGIHGDQWINLEVDTESPTVTGWNVTNATSKEFVNYTKAIREGDIITITALLSDLVGSVSKVWVIIWESVKNGAILFQGFLENISGGLWQLNITTNETWPEYFNYTIYANDTAGITREIEGNLSLTHNPRFAKKGFFLDRTQAEFNQGTYLNTTSNITGVVTLDNGNGTYTLRGNFTSRIYDAKGNVSWQNITFNGTMLGSQAKQNVTFQVRTCKESDCSGNDFFGEGNTSSTYYVTSGAVLNGSDSRYFQYKAYFYTNNSMNTGILNEVKVYYDSIGGNISEQLINQGENKTNAFDLDDYFFDPDEDNLTYSVTGNSTINVTIDSNNVVSFYPPSRNLTEYMTFIANDGRGVTTLSNPVRVSVEYLSLSENIDNNSVNANQNINLNGTVNFVNESGTNLLDNITVNIFVDSSAVTSTVNNVVFSSGTRVNTSIEGSYVTLTINKTNLTMYNDSYDVNTTFTSQAFSYSNTGWQSGTLFNVGQMGTDNTGNITYLLSNSLNISKVNISIITSSGVPANGNRSIYFSSDYSNWILANKTTTDNSVLSAGMVTGDNSSVYIKIEVDKSVGDPVITAVWINYTTNKYSSFGNFTSQVIDLGKEIQSIKNVTWTDNVPSTLTNLSVRTKVGNTSSPDATWTNWTNNLTKQQSLDMRARYIQYSVAFETRNTTETPLFYGLNITLVNTTRTNSNSFYSLEFNGPSSLGIHELLVNVSYGNYTAQNRTNFTTWGQTTLQYVGSQNYPDTPATNLAKYNITFNYSRTDDYSLISGLLNLTISNSTTTLARSCDGTSQCIQNFTISSTGDIIGGNYTIKLNATNLTGYYRNASASFDTYLYEIETDGLVYSYTESQSGVSYGVPHSFLYNVTLVNTNRSMMYNATVTPVLPVGSIFTAVQIYSLGCDNLTIYPNSNCTNEYNLTITVNQEYTTRQSGVNTINWKGLWTGIDSEKTSDQYVNNSMWVEIPGQIELNVSVTLINETKNLSEVRPTSIYVNTTGLSNINNLQVDYYGITLPSSWITFNSTSGVWHDDTKMWDQIASGGSVTLMVYLQVDPKNYTAGTFYGHLNFSGDGGANHSIYVTTTINPRMNISLNNTTETIKHGTQIFQSIILNTTDGNAPVTNISLSFLNSSMPSAWLAFNGSSISRLVENYSANITFNLSVPSYYDPGDYNGTINVSTKNVNYVYIPVKITVPSEGNWSYHPYDYNQSNSYDLNENGTVANITINNTGNVPLNLTIVYDNWGDSDYHDWPGEIFDENLIDSYGKHANPNSVYLDKNSTKDITIFQKGHNVPHTNMGIKLTISNTSSGTPASRIAYVSFNITDQPPNVTDIVFFLNNTEQRYYTELNQNTTLKMRVTDDLSILTTSGFFEVTAPNGTMTRHNAVANTTHNSEYKLSGANYIVLNFSTSFVPNLQGDYKIIGFANDTDPITGLSSAQRNLSRNITVYGYTVISTIGKNINVNDVNYNSSQNSTVYVLVNNTGYSKAYNLTINANNSDGFTIEYNNVTEVNRLEEVNGTLQVIVPARTPPGTYYITPNVHYYYANSTNVTTYGVNTAITINETNTFELVQSVATIEIGHGETGIISFLINATGNNNLTNLKVNNTFESDNITAILNDSLINVYSNVLENISVNISVDSYVNASNVSGIKLFKINGTNDDSVNNKGIFVNVTTAQNRSWKLNNDSLTINAVHNTPATNGLLNVSHYGTGDVELLFNISISNGNASNFINISNNTFTVTAGQVHNISLNYTAPNNDNGWWANLTIAELRYGTNRYVDIYFNSITLIVNISEINQTSFYNGEQVNVTVNLTYAGVYVNNNMTYSITINGDSCTKLSEDTANNQTKIICSIPTESDGADYNLTVRADYNASVGTVNTELNQEVHYYDVSAPRLVNITSNNIVITNATNYNLTVTDNVYVSKVIAQINYPNSSMKNYTMDNTSTFYYRSDIFNTVGVYEIRYFANDTSNNINSTETDSFEVSETSNFYGYILDLNSNEVETNFTTYNIGTSTQVKNFSTNGSGYYNVEHNKGNYRMVVDFLNFSADLDRVNLYNAQIDFINLDRLSSTDVDVTDAISGFAVDSDNATMNSTGTLTFSYHESQLSYSENYLAIYRCSDYTYSNRTCKGSWSIESGGTLNKVNNQFSVNLTSFANNVTAYMVAENVPAPEPDMVVDSLSTSVNHSTTVNVTLSITNIGNGAVKNVVFSCVSGDVCGNLTISSPSIETINIGEVYSAPVQIETLAGQKPLRYTGVLRLTSDNEIEDVNLFITVNNDTNWNITPTDLTIETGSYETVSSDTFTINNSGNNLLGFGLSNNVSLGLTDILIKVDKQNNSTFVANYTGVANIGVYNGFLNVTSNYSYSLINLTLNVSRSINVTGISPSTGLTSSQLIRVNVTANYSGTEITTNVTFTATIANVSCTNLSSSYSDGTWQITCITPDTITDLNRTLKVRGYLTDYDKYASDENVVSYGDLFPPYVKWQTPNVENSSNRVIINITITEESNLSSGAVTIISPTNAITLANLEYIKNNNYIINTTLTEIGDYQLNYSLTDGSANLNVGTNSTYFEVFTNLTFSGNVLKANESGSFVQFKLYRQNTTTVLNRFNTSATDGSYNETIHNRTYDLEMIYGNFTVTLEDIIFGKLGNDPIDIDDIDLKRVGVNNSRDLAGLSVNGTLKGSGSMKAEYEQNVVDDIYSINLYRCEVWNFSQSTCEGNWVGLDTTQGVGYVTSNIENFSGYLLSETTSVPTATATSSAGGAAAGGGGGGGAKLAERLQNLLVEALKASLSIAGIKISTTSIYKELYPGENTIAYISMQNSLSTPSNLEAHTEGDISNFVKLREENIQLNPSESKNIVIDIIAPAGATPGLYEGNIFLISRGVTVGVPATVRILKPSEKLLDLKIYPLKTTIAPGKELNIQTELYNLGQTKSIDVNLYLQLINPETEELLVIKEEQLVVQNTINTVKKLLIPEKTKEGKYLIKAIAYYDVGGNKLQSNALAYIEIKESILDYKLFGVTVSTWLGLVFVVALSWALYIYYLYKMAQRRRYLIKVDYRTLPQPGPKSAFVGKIAETGIRTFVNMDTLQTHTLIAGATGGGKTVAAMSVIEEALNKNIPVIVFDPTAQWTGFLRKCEDKNMLRRYKYFEMNENLAKGFNGSIHIIKDPREVIDIKDKMNPGEITIFNIGRLKPEQVDTVVASTIQQVFDASLPESRELKLLIVYDEVHRLLPKFGGSGNGFIQIEKGCREFRKWGVGLVLISQVLSDFVGEIKANIGTEIQLRTRYEGDLDRIKMKYGEDLAISIVKAAIGTGMFVNSEYNHGKPYFVSFRPLLHNTSRLDDKELDIYERYSTRSDDINYQLKQLKEEYNIDIFDLELELKLAKDKIKKGQFNMADVYLGALEPRVNATWKKLGKVPKQRTYKTVSETEIIKGIEEAKIGRKKFILEQEKNKLTKGEKSNDLDLEKKYNGLKELVEQGRNKNIDVSMQEIKLRELQSEIQIASSSKDQKEIEKVLRKIEGITTELKGQIGPKKTDKDELKDKAKNALQIAESAEAEVRKLLKKGSRKEIDRARDLAKKARLKAKELLDQLNGKE